MLKHLDEIDSGAVHRIRHLNDTLRKSGSGGRIVVTAGIAALPPVKIAAILNAVSTFDDFTTDNDPYGEHDCVSMLVAGERVIWKIDYYNLSLTCHSADPADPALTTRVLTVMLADEY